MKKRWLLPLILALVSIPAGLGVAGCNDSSAIGTGVLEGKVNIRPRPPEEIGQPYPPEVYQKRKVMIYDANHETLIKQVDIDSGGYYRVEIPAGIYPIAINYVESGGVNAVQRN